jgi:hypothetical protein
MYYWRQTSFDTLEHIQKRFAGIPELSDYVRYIELLAKGLRKEALKHIEDLVSTLHALPEDQQRHFASLLCRETEDETGHRLLPDPLSRRFIQPVIEEWKRVEPGNPEPLRWTGILDDLIRAVQLDPSCDLTRRRLILRILGFVGYSTHELPSGYLGVVEDDKDLLRVAKREAELLVDGELRQKYLRLVEGEKQEIEEYEKRKKG